MQNIRGHGNGQLIIRTIEVIHLHNYSSSTSSSNSTLDSLTVNSLTGSLSIASIRKVDEGNYTCSASNKAGKLEASAFLAVLVEPAIDTLENVTVLEGVPSVSLPCIARGDPRPSVHWRKQGLQGLLTDEDNIEVTEEKQSDDNMKVTYSTLTIRSPEPEDEGVYECVAVNEVGRHSNSAKLIVEFGPNFESQEMKVQWSWDQKPVSLSCVGENL